jgi:hypothetical protein
MILSRFPRAVDIILEILTAFITPSVLIFTERREAVPREPLRIFKFND